MRWLILALLGPVALFSGATLLAAVGLAIAGDGRLSGWMIMLHYIAFAVAVVGMTLAWRHI